MQPPPPTLPQEGRGGDDYYLEVDPQQDPPRLQCASRHFFMTIPNSPLPDRAHDNHVYGLSQKHYITSSGQDHS